MIQYLNSQRNSGAVEGGLLEKLFSNENNGLISMNSNNSMSSTPSQRPAGGGKAGQQLHQGKWTPEEEEYVECLISEFRAGQLPLAEGTSLRIFLSKMLNCNPMRISKKFVNTSYNGKQVYVKKPNTMSSEEVKQRLAKLKHLEQRFQNRIAPFNGLEQPSSLGMGQLSGELSFTDRLQGNSSNSNNNNKASLAFGKIVSDLQVPFSSNTETAATMDSLSSSFVGGRSDQRAAACGRALLDNFNSSKTKSMFQQQTNIQPPSSLNNMSDSELLAELQRRTNNNTSAGRIDSGALNMLKNSISVASCSSLQDLDLNNFQAQQRGSASFGNNSFSNLPQEIPHASSSSGNVFDPSLELALQSLVSQKNEKPNQNSALDVSSNAAPFSNLLEKQSALNSFSMLSSPSLGNLLNTEDILKDAADLRQNQQQNHNTSSSSSNISDLMMKRLKQSLSSQSQHSSVQPSNPLGSGNSNANLEGLLRGMGSRLNMQNNHRRASIENFGLSSAASLADMFHNPVDAFAVGGSGAMQNQTFDFKSKQRHETPTETSSSSNSLLSGSIADFLANQRLNSAPAAVQKNECQVGSRSTSAELMNSLSSRIATLKAQKADYQGGSSSSNTDLMDMITKNNLSSRVASLEALTQAQSSSQRVTSIGNMSSEQLRQLLLTKQKQEQQSSIGNGIGAGSINNDQLRQLLQAKQHRHQIKQESKETDFGTISHDQKQQQIVDTASISNDQLRQLLQAKQHRQQVKQESKETDIGTMSYNQKNQLDESNLATTDQVQPSSTGSSMATMSTDQLRQLLEAKQKELQGNNNAIDVIHDNKRPFGEASLGPDEDQNEDEVGSTRPQKRIRHDGELSKFEV